MVFVNGAGSMPKPAIGSERSQICKQSLNSEIGEDLLVYDLPRSFHDFSMAFGSQSYTPICDLEANLFFFYILGTSPDIVPVKPGQCINSRLQQRNHPP